jgi:hypothetical protein
MLFKNACAQLFIGTSSYLFMRYVALYEVLCHSITDPKKQMKLERQYAFEAGGEKDALDIANRSVNLIMNEMIMHNPISCKLLSLKKKL